MYIADMHHDQWQTPSFPSESVGGWSLLPVYKKTEKRVVVLIPCLSGRKPSGVLHELENQRGNWSTIMKM